jgi:hypothetical protein
MGFAVSGISVRSYRPARAFARGGKRRTARAAGAFWLGVWFGAFGFGAMSLLDLPMAALIIERILSAERPI